MMRARRPSPGWLIMMATTIALAVAVGLTAVAHQRASDRPIGEGELFFDDAQFAASRVMNTMHDGMEEGTAIRHVRNQLTVEALSVVSSAGIVIESTSLSMVGTELDHDLLAFGHFDQRFVAVAMPLGTTLEIDGVTEWYPGDVVYQVVHPLEDGASLLMSYDISQLLARRAQASGIQAFTVQLLGVALFFLSLSAALAIGRSRAARRYRQLEFESEILRTRSEDLEEHNARLDEALALAEETNRVRAEFVLMINHELRTPLTGVVTGAELLSAEVARMSPEDRDRLLEDMVTDGRRLQEMIAQMLVVARIENRGLNFELESVPVADVCAELGARHPRIDPDHVVADGVGAAVVRTDAGTLAQVVGSLADNALTHGAGSVWIECTDSLSFTPMHQIGAPPRDGIYFLVHDDGPGIAEHFLPRAFEKFEKLSQSSGTGLGLYLVAVMTEALGASLSVDTGPDGTTMAIGVPRVPASPLAEVSS